MLALQLDGSPKLIADHPAPTRRRGESLLRTRLAGICDTDLQLIRGYMQFRGVLGHEVVADVVEADDPSTIGRRVVVDINASCGVCPECRDDDGHHCPSRTVLGISGRDGVFAERFVMPDHCLVRVPDRVTDDEAVFAEPLAAALHVLDEVDPDYVSRAIVIGDGKLGLLIGMVLALARIRVTQVGHHPSKLELLRPYEVETVLDPDETGGLGRVPLVVEASGSEAGLELALRLVMPRGKLVLKTTTAGRSSLALAPVVVDEVALVGSRCGNMRTAVDWLAHKSIDPTPMIAARYPLVRAEEALQHANMPNVLKVLIQGA